MMILNRFPTFSSKVFQVHWPVHLYIDFDGRMDSKDSLQKQVMHFELQVCQNYLTYLYHLATKINHNQLCIQHVKQ